MPETSVRFRDCACPGTPHPEEGDVAEFRPYLDFRGGAEALRAIRELVATDPDASIDNVKDRLGEVLGPIFIRRGVIDWNLLDEDGDPVPVTDYALDDLPWVDAYELAARGDDLYGDSVLAPLVKRQSTSSKAGRTAGSTRRPRKSSPKPPTPSEPSSSPSSESDPSPS